MEISVEIDPRLARQGAEPVPFPSTRRTGLNRAIKSRTVGTRDSVGLINRSRTPPQRSTTAIPHFDLPGSIAIKQSSSGIRARLGNRLGSSEHQTPNTNQSEESILNSSFSGSDASRSSRAIAVTLTGRFRERI